MKELITLVGNGIFVFSFGPNLLGSVGVTSTRVKKRKKALFSR